MANGLNVEQRLNEVLRGDNGRDQRQADHPPGKAAAGQGVIFGGVLLSGNVQGKNYNEADETSEGKKVKGVELHIQGICDGCNRNLIR